MNRRDQSYDTNSTFETNELDHEPDMDETEQKFEKEFQNVTKKIQSTVNKFLQKGEDITVVKEAIRKALKESKPGSKKTENTSEPTVKGDTMSASKQKKISIVKSTKPEVETIPATVSPNLSSDLKGESLSSLNLIKSSAKHLHDLMKSVVHGQEATPEDTNPFKLMDMERAKTSAIVAKQFYSVMRLQLDAVKLIREMNQDG